jgi:hypothetical protein
VTEIQSTYQVVSDAEAAFNFVTQYYDLCRNDGQKGIVQIRNGEVIAAALYVENNGTNCFLHVAGKPGRRWLTRDFLYWCLHYPFVQCGLKRMTAWIEATNADSLRFAKHTGWKHEATLKGAGVNGVDVWLHVLWREDCRYV